MCRLILVVTLILVAAGCSGQRDLNPIVLEHRVLNDAGLTQSIVLEQMMSGFSLPAQSWGFDYEAAEQRRLNHLVKFQAQLRQQ